jgi:hypothetical protein
MDRVADVSVWDSIDHARAMEGLARMRAQRPIQLSAIRPGSIVVLHKGTDDRRGVVETTDHVRGELARAGLRAVIVSELVTLRRQPRRPRLQPVGPAGRDLRP